MTLPIDLVLIRHGQSEGNLAKRLSESGDHSAYTENFLNRHSSTFRLTELGKHQAHLAGEWIRQEFFNGQLGFDRYLTSEYLRAVETAGLLNLPGAIWFTDFYLTERDWGELDVLSPSEREEKFGSALRRREIEPFFWRPPNGENFSELCLRIDRVLHTLHNECSDKKVCIVCHGEVIWAFRIRIERLSQARFKKLVFTKNSEERIYNCQIVHYTRRDPANGRLNHYANWFRTIRPTETPIWTSGWQEIKRSRYSNEDLLKIVSQTTPMLK